MEELKILIEFIVAVVSAYFLMKIEIVKLSKDIHVLQERLTKLELRTEQHEESVHKDLQEIKDMIHSIQIRLAEQLRRT